MIKGCQRKMIVVQGKDKSIFETAYFVLRHESEQKALAFLKEHTRRCVTKSKSVRKGSWPHLSSFRTRISNP